MFDQVHYDFNNVDVEGEIELTTVNKCIKRVCKWNRTNFMLFIYLSFQFFYLDAFHTYIVFLGLWFYLFIDKL